jgi:hypothetical protein
VPDPTDVDRDAPVLTDFAIDIDAPRDRVWTLHTDVNAWPGGGKYIFLVIDSGRAEVTQAAISERLRRDTH